MRPSMADYLLAGRRASPVAEVRTAPAHGRLRARACQQRYVAFIRRMLSLYIATCW